jgi:hypothetical protein
MLHFTYTRYASGNGLAIQLTCEDGEPFATLSVNMPGEPLGEDEFFLKDWSENEEVAAAVRELGVFEPLGRFASSGYVVVQAYRAPKTPPPPFAFGGE